MVGCCSILPVGESWVRGTDRDDGLVWGWEGGFGSLCRGGVISYLVALEEESGGFEGVEVKSKVIGPYRRSYPAPTSE